MIAPGDGINAYGVVYRLFTDASGLGLAEQARRLMHPDPPQEGGGVGGVRGDVAAQDAET